GERLLMVSLHPRSGSAQMVSEFVATFRLLSVIWGCSRRRSDAVPFAVGAYIAAAYWFTASTSFANPAVTLARALTDTFAGIRPAEVGVDLSSAATSQLTRELAQRAQMLITMGCGDQCPVVPGLQRDDWPLRDLKSQPLEIVRQIRDEIRHRVESLLAREG